MSFEPNKRRFRRPLLVLLVFSLFSALVLGRAMGRWLVREDNLSSADAIVVLSGSMPYRAEEAAKVFAIGNAPEVWVTRPKSPATELQGMGIHYICEEDYNRNVLVNKGVHEASVRVLPDPVVNTQQEVEEIAREMKRTGMTKVIIVTSPPHTSIMSQ